MICASFKKIIGEKSDNVNIIKRMAGYMLVESCGISFRDFKNYTAPMSLEELAKSCGLDTAKYTKGGYCYEWYTSVDQLSRALHFPAYVAFQSSMFIQSSKAAQELNALIKKGAIDGSWPRPRNSLGVGFEAIEVGCASAASFSRPASSASFPAVRLRNSSRPALSSSSSKDEFIVKLAGFLHLDALIDDPAVAEWLDDELCEVPAASASDLIAYYIEQLYPLFTPVKDAQDGVEYFACSLLLSTS